MSVSNFLLVFLAGVFIGLCIAIGIFHMVAS